MRAVGYVSDARTGERLLEIEHADIDERTGAIVLQRETIEALQRLKVAGHQFGLHFMTEDVKCEGNA